MEPNFQMKISLWILQLETSQVAENTSRVQIYMLGFAARSPRARPKVTAPAKRGSPTAPPALALPLTWGLWGAASGAVPLSGVCI